MESKRTKWIAVLMVLGLMAAGPVAYAAAEADVPASDTGMEKSSSGDEGPGKRSGWHRRGPEEFFKGLDLTPEQKEKLKAQRESKKESMRALREQMKTKMQALHETISKPETKRADVDGLLGEVNALKGQMFSQMIDGVFAMKEVLTPEQFAKMQAKRQEQMKKKHHGGPDGDEPGPEKE